MSGPPSWRRPRRFHGAPATCNCFSIELFLANDCAPAEYCKPTFLRNDFVSRFIVGKRVAAINFRDRAFSKKNQHSLRIKKLKIHTRVVIYTRTVVSCSYVLFLGIGPYNSGVTADRDSVILPQNFNENGSKFYFFILKIWLFKKMFYNVFAKIFDSETRS